MTDDAAYTDTLGNTRTQACRWRILATIGYMGRGPITDIVGVEGNKPDHYQMVSGMKYLVTPVDVQKANAEFIVRAVNSHDDLVDALDEMLAVFSHDPGESIHDPKYLAIMKAAIAMDKHVHSKATQNTGE